MAQQVWTFYDKSGALNTFGMHHGEESGHVLAYLNNEILIIDFGIKDDKTYSFFFDDELLQFKIIKRSDAFEYILATDRDAPTPLNKKIKLQKKQERLVVITLVLVAAVAAYLIGSLLKK